MSFPLKKKQELPYSLLLDPDTNRAAAYTFNHRLITENASQTLVRFALENTAQEAAFDQSKHDPKSEWRPLPGWASDDLLDRLKLVWIKRPDGEAPDEEWQAIPAR
ncbi:hypothetical protein GY15_28635 [Delftia sp. 670]|uniref:hypothetical protein n=1 Tax=Delftia TaxID=80865 RepID=UPI0004D3B4AD|nr:hypothetical protein [Delftia lacustris]KEH11417.1 hypothetical protein GY15_28635 [Delftia sp. 670]